MKRLLYVLPLLLLCMLANSCSDLDDKEDIIWDFSPVNFLVQVENASGQDLLNEHTEGNILSETLTLTYDGKTNPVQTDIEEGEETSRYYMPHWYGAVRRYDSETDRYFIVIGEFDGSEDGKKEVTLTLGERRYNLAFTNKVTLDGRVCTVDRKFYLDGNLYAENLESSSCLYTIKL